MKQNEDRFDQTYRAWEKMFSDRDTSPPLSPVDLEPSASGKLLRKAIEYYPVSQDLIDGFNHLLEVKIPARLRIPFYRSDRVRAWFDDLEYFDYRSKDQIPTYPIEAMLYQFTYDRELRARLYVSQLDSSGEWKISRSDEKLSLGKLPIMIGSNQDSLLPFYDNPAELRARGAAPEDVKGYFIIDGSEYAIMTQQQLRSNILLAIPPRHNDKSQHIDGSVKIITSTKSYSMHIRMDSSGVLRMIFDGLQNFKLRKLLPDKRDKIETVTHPEGINCFQTVIILSTFIPEEAFLSNRQVVNRLLEFSPEEHRKKLRDYWESTKIDQLDESYSFVNKENFDTASNLPDSWAKMRFIRDLIYSSVFPNLNPVEQGPIPVSQEEILVAVRQKIDLLLVTIVHYSLIDLGIRPADDIDSWACSQATSPAMSYYTYFNNLWNSATSSSGLRGSNIYRVILDAEKSPDQIINPNDLLSRMAVKLKIKDGIFTEPFIRAFKSKSFRMKKGSKTDNSTQELIRRSILASLVHLNRIVVRAQANSPMVKKRMVHLSQIGYVDMMDTSENADICGLTKSKATTARISVEEPQSHVLAVLEGLLENSPKPGLIPILAEYHLLGWGNRRQVVQAIIQARRQRKIGETTGVISDGIVVNVLLSAGRLVRPLLVADGQKLDIENLSQLSFRNLLRKGIVEYVDAAEQDVGYNYGNLQFGDYLLISPDPSQLRSEHTHCEIDPGAILGYVANTMPLLQHNQGVRNSYGSNKGTQAMGRFLSNVDLRFDTENKTLVNAEVPLVRTCLAKEFFQETDQPGSNVILAIMNFKGYNQEDGIVLRKRSVERGLFSSIIRKTVSRELIQTSGERTESFKNIANLIDSKQVTNPRRREVYKHLDADGFPIPGSLIREGDCILGVVTRAPGTQNFQTLYDDHSEYATGDLDATIVDSYAILHKKGTTTVRISLIRIKYPEVGDKVVSRHSQKSIIAAIVDDEELPYDPETGTVPDMIMNPLSIPSRMTIAQIHEIVLATMIAQSGTVIDGSAWTSPYENLIREGLNTSDLLRAIGERHGCLYKLHHRGTGEPISDPVFMGPCYYQVVSHQVHYKIQSRQLGSVERTTKQANGGRQTRGGVKFGTMELSATVAHGAMHVALDRLTSSSGLAEIVICGNCGTNLSATISLYQNYEFGAICPRCGRGEEAFRRVKVRPAAMYFADYISAAGVKAVYVSRDLKV